MTAPPDDIDCPLCGVPHLARAKACDACGQDLHAQPNFAALREELADRRQGMMLAAMVITLMIAANFAVFGGAGYLVIVAPFRARLELDSLARPPHESRSTRTASRSRARFLIRSRLQ